MTQTALIIIPCLNEENYIEGLVEKLVADTKKLKASIIIADGGSEDRTPDIAKSLAEKYKNVEYLSNPKRIQSAAVNLAVETFGKEAEYLIRIDAHADYPEDFCKSLLEEAQETGADSVVVSMNTVGKEGFQKAVAAAQNSKLGNGGSAHRNLEEDGKWVDHGHHALMRIAAFQDVGGYDESFSHNEDAELDTRLTKAGYKIWLTAKTSMTYYPRDRAMPLFKQYYNFGHGRARNLLKHKTKPHLRQMIPVSVMPVVVLTLLGFADAIFLLPTLLWAGICIGYGLKLAYDASDKDLTLSGPAAMIMHFAWSLGFWVGALDHTMGNVTGASK